MVVIVVVFMVMFIVVMVVVVVMAVVMAVMIVFVLAVTFFIIAAVVTIFMAILTGFAMLALLVLVHVAAEPASVTALGAQERLLTRVNALMSVQISGEAAGIVANLTHIRLLPGVNPPKEKFSQQFGNNNALGINARHTCVFPIYFVGYNNIHNHHKQTVFPRHGPSYAFAAW